MRTLREMPRPDAAELGALYRQRVAEGLVVCADAARASYPIHPGFRDEWGCLSIVAVRNGYEEYHFPKRKRTLVVDDDVYLVLGASSRYSYRLRSLGTARCLMVCFPPRMVEEASSTLTDDLSDGVLSPAPVVEQLSSHDDLVTPELSKIEQACLEGDTAPEWYRQQAGILLSRLVEKSQRATAQFARLPGLRASTRRELARRIAMATDCIHDGYREPLPLEALADQAGLSPFHFLRAFKDLHGVTPQEFLQRKRAAVAKRLLSTTKLSRGQVASRVGFRSRASLYRWLRRAETPGG